jgi:hypothetical protein
MHKQQAKKPFAFACCVSVEIHAYNNQVFVASAPQTTGTFAKKRIRKYEQVLSKSKPDVNEPLYTGPNT